MSTTSQDLFPYPAPVINRLRPLLRQEGDYIRYSGPGSLPPIDADTGTAEILIDLILMGVEANRGRNIWAGPHQQPTPYFGRIARLEFVWDAAADQRGVVLFDSHSKLVVHVLHALLGYDGSGSLLSQRIMQIVGIDERMFKAIQSATREPYTVVISREKRAHVHGVEVAVGSDEVEDRWSWWRA